MEQVLKTQQFTFIQRKVSRQAVLEKIVMDIYTWVVLNTGRQIALHITYTYHKQALPIIIHDQYTKTNIVKQKTVKTICQS